MKRSDAADSAPNATRDPSHDPSRDPWRAPVIVAQIPESGQAFELEASPAQRAAMAKVAGLRGIMTARATFELMPERGGRVHVTGRVHALIGQTCVVTLDEIENEIDEAVDLTFAPPDQIKELADLVDEDDDEAEVPDPPEPILDGVVDLGRLATDVLFLAIDPYPRKGGAVFEPRVEAQDPEDHPFAALKDLRLPDTATANPDKAKDKSKDRPKRK